MFSCSLSLLLVLLILRSDTTADDDFMTQFCLSTDTHSQTEKAQTSAPLGKYTEQQPLTEVPEERSHESCLTPEQCCVHFSFMLPSSKPSTSHKESRLDCPERVVMTKNISSFCEDHDTEWLEHISKAYHWCLMKGYVQDSSKTHSVSISQFLDSKGKEECCYLFSQSPDQVFTPLERKIPNVCEPISFNVTLRTNKRNCMRKHTRLVDDFISKTYNCLRWAFRDDRLVPAQPQPSQRYSERRLF